MTKLAEKAAAPVAPEPPPLKLQEVDPANVQLNDESYVVRTFIVRLPKGWTAATLNEWPQGWSRVQARPRAMRKLDRLVCISFEEDWLAECWVAEASQVSVTLAKPKITQLGARQGNLYRDDQFFVEWQGRGFIVRRVSDGFAVVSEPQATEQLAIREIKNLYPQKMG